MVGQQGEILPKTIANCQEEREYTAPCGLPGNAAPCYLAGAAGRVCTGGYTEEMGKQEGGKMLRLCSAV